MQFLGQEQPELPEVALPRDGDHAVNQGDSVIRLDNLLDGESEIELEQVVKRVTVYPGTEMESLSLRLRE